MKLIMPMEGYATIIQGPLIQTAGVRYLENKANSVLLRRNAFEKDEKSNDSVQFYYK